HLLLKRNLEFNVPELTRMCNNILKGGELGYRWIRGGFSGLRTGWRLGSISGAVACVLCLFGPCRWLAPEIANDVRRGGQLRRVAHANDEHFGGGERPRRARGFVQPLKQHLPGDGEPRHRNCARELIRAGFVVEREIWRIDAGHRFEAA